MNGLEFHYRSEGVSATDRHLTCGRLTQIIMDSCARLAPAERAAPLELQQGGVRPGAERRWELPPAEVGGPGEAPPEDALFDASNWENVKHLQWTLRSDREIGDAELQRCISALESQGMLSHVKASMRKLVRALSAVYPVFKDEPQASVAQLVALGREFTVSAAEDSEFYEFVKKELQPVDLAALLGL